VVKRQYKVVWEDDAKATLRGIYNYIKKHGSLEQAKKVRTQIKQEGDSLGFIPHKYIKEPILKSTSRDIRFKVIWSYKLIYEVFEKQVIILDIIHTSRDPQVLKSVK
jgi:plasmid stabilization system protein ParE